MAAFVRARTFSRPSHSAPGAPYIGRAFLYGLGAMGEDRVSPCRSRSFERSSTLQWRCAETDNQRSDTGDFAAVRA